MKKQARIVDDVAVDVTTGDPAEMFHPDIATQFESVPNNVEIGWRRDPQTGVWAAPEAAPERPNQATVFPKIGPIAFKLLFSAQERIKAKQLCPTDDFLEDFWGMLDDPRTDVVDLGHSSVQSAVEYTLTAVKDAGVELDVLTRKAAILSGQVQ